MTPRITRTRTFEAQKQQVELVKRELTMYLEALSHDPQYAIHRACKLLSILALPRRMPVREQMEKLEAVLALRREKTGWGRPWSFGMIRKLYYAKGVGFRRSPPKPVTRAEMEGYTPSVPPSRSVYLARKTSREVNKIAGGS